MNAQSGFTVSNIVLPFQEDCVCLCLVVVANYYYLFFPLLLLLL